MKSALHNAKAAAPARQAMGERGRTFVRENYFTGRLIKDLMALYRELLA